MKINGRITLLFNHDGMILEIDDADAVVTFCKIELNQEQTCKVLSRLGNVACECNVFGLNNVGKNREKTMLDFPIGLNVGYGEDRKKIAVAESAKHCPVGWEPDYYFGSQGSFYEKDGQTWARCGIRRWVEKGE